MTTAIARNDIKRKNAVGIKTDCVFSVAKAFLWERKVGSHKASSDELYPLIDRREIHLFFILQFSVFIFQSVTMPFGV